MVGVASLDPHQLVPHLSDGLWRFRAAMGNDADRGGRMAGLPGRPLRGSTRGCGECPRSSNMADGPQEMDTGDHGRCGGPTLMDHAARMDALLVCRVDPARGCLGRGGVISPRSPMAEPAVVVGGGYVGARNVFALGSMDV